jgi:hypothetical protein
MTEETDIDETIAGENEATTSRINGAGDAQRHEYLQATDANMTTNLATIGRVTVKPPVFYRSNPQVWFRQMDSQFALANITSEVTKFHHIMGAIPEDVAINLPTDISTYEGLKSQIISIYQKNKQELLEEALGSISLNGQKPSVCLLRIKRKLQECNLTVDNDVVRHRLLQAMPINTRVSLSAHSQLPLDQFAKLADTIYLYSQENGFGITAQVSSTPAYAEQGDVSAVSVMPGNYQPQRRDFRPIVKEDNNQRLDNVSFALRPFNSNQRPKLCRFHLYFAEKANRCKPWCKWPGSKPPCIDPSSRPPTPTSFNSGNA